MLIVAMGQRNRFVLDDQNQMRKRSQSKAVLDSRETEVVVRKVVKLVEQNSVMRCHSHGPGKLACLAGQIVVHGRANSGLLQFCRHQPRQRLAAASSPASTDHGLSIEYSTVPVHNILIWSRDRSYITSIRSLHRN